MYGGELPKWLPRGYLDPHRPLTGAASPPLLPVICKQQAPELEPAATLPPLPQPPLAPAAPVAPAQGTPSMDELIQQSQWNLQQQEQHLLALRQVRAAPPALPLLPRGTRHSPLPRFRACALMLMTGVSTEDGDVPLPRAWCEAAVTPPAPPPPLLCLARTLGLRLPAARSLHRLTHTCPRHADVDADK